MKHKLNKDYKAMNNGRQLEGFDVIFINYIL